MPGESDAGTDAPGSVSGAAGAAASVGSGLASARRLAFDVRPCVCHACRPFKEKQICGGKLTNNEIKKRDVRKGTDW